MRALIAYDTRAGENYFNGAIRSIDKGNTEVIAEKLQELTALPEGDFDVLYLAFPNYCGTMPMAILHFWKAFERKA